MIIVHGVYHFRPTRVGFRNDYCLWCRRERRSILIRTFDAWHILWIPMLPLGLLKRWHCTVCGRQPHLLPSPRRSLQRAGLIALLMISILVWKVPAKPDDVLVLWAFRVGAPVGAVLVLRHLLRPPKDPSLKQLLADIVPANDMTCLFCATPLIAGSRWSCPNCCAVRY